jgi:hypothetical protein
MGCSKPNVVYRGGEPGDVTQILAVALADPNISNRAGYPVLTMRFGRTISHGARHSARIARIVAGTGLAAFVVTLPPL